ncbi:TetR/AcrR family transcriptional regulator [Rummeliibacillus pycnus]|uniref:TetR/AcrR family transcriptional regulator n=1 Tax=Rummeliibacillus pycnus TaxID=101070 RepID=UPI003D2D37B0
MKLSEKKLQKKKEEIILSAVKIVNEKGYQGATMEEIAAELLMTKGSLYYYFKNKEDLIFQCHVLVLDQGIKELEVIFNREISNEQKLKLMIASHIRFAIEKKETFNMIIKPEKTFHSEQLNPILQKRNEYSSWFDQVIEEGVKVGEFKIKELKIVRMILLGAMNWIQQWYKPNGEKKIEEVQEIYEEYLMKVVK